MEDNSDFRGDLTEAKDTSIAHLLVRAARLLNEESMRRVQANPRYRGARAGHLAIFPHLDLDGTRLTELARRMGVTKQAVSQLVDELERIGVLAREPDPDDRRAKRVVFTDRGRTFMLEGLAILRSVEEDVLTSMPPENRARLRDDLARIIEVLLKMSL
ncbi:MAG: MarR family transcriptional regulator [Myxococcota bacterium]